MVLAWEFEASIGYIQRDLVAKKKKIEGIVGLNFLVNGFYSLYI
jgi:hypothetical protein